MPMTDDNKGTNADGYTIRSYLSWMKDRGELDDIIDNSTLLWRIAN